MGEKIINLKEINNEFIISFFFCFFIQMTSLNQLIHSAFEFLREFKKREREREKKEKEESKKFQGIILTQRLHSSQPIQRLPSTSLESKYT